MRKFYSLVLLIIAVASSLTVSAQGLKGFKLKNGLSVYIWEDSTKSDVFGLVGVKVGAVNDPEDLTGLAHYLEHMMFKGTQSISSLNSFYQCGDCFVLTDNFRKQIVFHS